MEEDGFTRVTSRSKRRARPCRLPANTDPLSPKGFMYTSTGRGSAIPRCDGLTYDELWLCSCDPSNIAHRNVRTLHLTPSSSTLDSATLQMILPPLAATIASSALHCSLVRDLETALEGETADLVVYGVGAFASNEISRYQVAEALALYASLSCGDARPLIYDPVFGEVCRFK